MGGKYVLGVPGFNGPSVNVVAVLIIQYQNLGMAGF